jgi:hypothetical protein
LKVYKDVRLANPFLRPYWRHERVMSMLASVPPERTKRYDDKYVQGYKKFLFQWNKSENNRDRLMHENPGLFFAYLLHDRTHIEPELRLMIEARLLAGADYDKIAHEAKTIPETVEWYERLFFNVSPFLTHHDWIVKHVLLPSSDRFVEDSTEEEDDEEFAPRPSIEVVRPHLDMTLKFFAYFGGPLICDVMISGFRRDKRITSYEEIPDYFNDQFASQIMRRSAQASGQFEINKYNVMELFTTHSRLIEIQRSIEGQDERHNEFEKHINAMLSELPWTAGLEGAKLFDKSPIGMHDEGAAELNEEELMIYGSGRTPDSVEGVAELTIASRREPEKNHAKS